MDLGLRHANTRVLRIRNRATMFAGASPCERSHRADPNLAARREVAVL